MRQLLFVGSCLLFLATDCTPNEELAARVDFFMVNETSTTFDVNVSMVAGSIFNHKYCCYGGYMIMPSNYCLNVERASDGNVGEDVAITIKVIPSPDVEPVERIAHHKLVEGVQQCVLQVRSLETTSLECFPWQPWVVVKPGICMRQE